VPACRSCVLTFLCPDVPHASPCACLQWPITEDSDGPAAARMLRVKQCLPDFPMLVPIAAIHPTIGKTYEAFSLPGSRVGWVGLNAAGRRCV